MILRRLPNKNTKVAILLFLFSFIVRLPFLNLYPIFRVDELGENIRGLAIVEYGFIPLTNNAEFIGALYNYLIALVYMIKPSILLSRFVIAIFGSLTVPLLYFLTLRITKNSLKALLASLILALSPAHILISSHVAWSASLAPFFLTISLLYLVKTLEIESKKDIFIFGLTAGLALQSHPSTIASYIAFTSSWLLLFDKKLLSSVKFVKYCFLGFIIGYLNMLIFNIINPLGSIVAMFKAPWTGFHGSMSFGEFIRRIVFIFTEYATMIISGVPILSIQYLVKKPMFYMYLAIFLIITVYVLLKSVLARFLLIYSLIALLILSIGTKGAMSLNIFGFAWGPHYLQQLLPLNSMFMAEVLSVILYRLRRIGKVKSSLISAVVLLLIVIWPCTNMLAVYSFVAQGKCTNEVFLETISSIKSRFGEETPIFVEFSLKNQVTLIVYEIAVLEKLNIYPPLNLFKRHVSLDDLKIFLKENENKTLLILVLPLKSRCTDFLEELIAKGYLTVVEHVVAKACYNTQLYRIIVVKKC